LRLNAKPRYRHVLATCLLAITPIAAAAQDTIATGTPAQPSLAAPAATAALVARAQARGRIRVIVQLRDQLADESLLGTSAAAAQRAKLASSQRALLTDLGARLQPDGSLAGPGVQAVSLFTTIPYLALSADSGGLERLTADPRVAGVQEDVAVPPTLAQSVPLIRANQAWALGFDGTGQTVAVLDTGVAKSHPAFAGGKVVSEACFSTTVPGQSTSLCPGGASSSIAPGSGLNCVGVPGCDHGTHVASIAVGNSASIKGVAPGARLIAVKVFSRFDSRFDCGGAAPCILAFTSDIIRGLERVHALRNTFAIASANMSLGGGQSSTACNTSPVKGVIDQLRSARIATAIASGNDGFNGSVGHPGCISTAVTVGSTTKTDQISFFSNHASLVDLLAPGSSILAAVPGGSGFKSGTSMATPHVAGAWAILKQGKPVATVREVQAALACTGVPLSRAGITKPRINVLAALNVLRSPAPGCA